MGKVTQLLYAMLPGAKGIATVNLMAAGITAASGHASADLLTDLKSGYLLGANPRKQFLAQFFGIFFGIFAMMPAWYAMVPNKTGAGNLSTRPPPTCGKPWRIAHARHPHAAARRLISAIVIGGLLGCRSPVVEKLFPKAQALICPPRWGLGLSWVVPFQNAFSFAIGAVIVLVWQKVNRKKLRHLRRPDCLGLGRGRIARGAPSSPSPAPLVGLVFAAK